MNQLQFNRFKIPAWMFVYVGFVIVLTLSPFEFSRFYFNMFLSQKNILAQFFSIEPIDPINNVILFIPWGLLLSFYFKRFEKKFVPVVAGLGLMFSIGIETAQLFLIRSTSGLDLLTNTAGTVLGYWLGTTWLPEKQILNKLKYLWNHVGVWRLVFVVYLSLLVVLLGVPIAQMNFDNWNDRFHLYVGNEGTNDRPWFGNLYGVAIYDNALSAKQIDQLCDAPMHSNFDSLRLSMGAAVIYTITEGQGDTLFASEKGRIHLPLAGDSLTWLPEKKGLQVQGHCIGTSTGAAELTQMLKKTRSFTVETIIQPTDLKQSGPARIVTLSDNTTRRNFMVGQSGKDLYFRVRTPLNGNNGSNIQIQGKGALPDTSVHHVAATFYRGVEKLYVDGELGGRSLRIDLDYTPRLVRIGKTFGAQWAFLWVVVFSLVFLSNRIFKKADPFLTGLLSLSILTAFDLILYFWLGQAFTCRFWLPVLVWLFVSSVIVTIITASGDESETLNKSHLNS